jgi:3-deoxy-D-manno-octulosonate 8-phosphate phosphatase (KDO 8-P phosphatase)
MPLPHADLFDRLKQIRLLLLDVDGVLTDGGIVYNDNGQEIKCFNAKDGLGIRLLMGAGVRVGVVTGRRAPALVHRCNNLGIELIFDGIRDKAAALDQIVAQVGIDKEQIAFMGDDLPDLSIMRRVGLAVAVADARAEVQKGAAMVTTSNGGAGAVRELCEAILKAKGLWQNIMERFSE